MSESIDLKFVILGEGRVDKTSILNRYFTNKFNETEKSTINSAFYEKKVIYKNKEYILKFWDTAGQEQFNAINNMYYQNCVGALIVYDVAISETFEKAKSWLQTLYEVVGKDITVVITGNKFDKANKELIDEYKIYVDNYCKQENIKHFYVSSKTGFNLEETFNSLINSTLKKVSQYKIEKINKGRGRKLEIKEQEYTKKKCY